jgi:alkylation response protein AidB-like acyl-CoA dehydrogenase
VDFGLDETKQSVADLAATVLRGDPDGNRAEQALTGPAGYDETLWKAMAQAGLLALAVPAELGGDGLGPVEVACVLTEVGRQIMPVPALATLSLGVLPVALLAPAQVQRDLLPEVSDGRILTGAIRAHVTGDRDGDTTVLTGSALGVPYAAQAHRVLVPTSAGVYAVDPRTDAVTCTRTPSSTKSAEYTVRLDRVRVADADLVTTDVAAVERLALAGALAVADGVIAGALDLTARHLRERHQFGKPLATFQAVAQQIADVYITAQTLHLAARSLNWRLATGRDAADDADVSAYWLAAELPAALQSCHHLHGGLGVDYSYPMHRYYAQGKDLARFVGGAETRLDLIGDRCASS